MVKKGLYIFAGVVLLGIGAFIFFIGPNIVHYAKAADCSYDVYAVNNKDTPVETIYLRGGSGLLSIAKTDADFSQIEIYSADDYGKGDAYSEETLLTHTDVLGECFPDATITAN